jgi:hypothetical protein
VEFLGHDVDKKNIRPIMIIQKKNQYITATNKKGNSKVHGVIELHRKFITNYSYNSQILYDLLKSSEKSMKWEEKHEKSLGKNKTTIQYDINLSHFNKSA